MDEEREKKQPTAVKLEVIPKIGRRNPAAPTRCPSRFLFLPGFRVRKRKFPASSWGTQTRLRCWRHVSLQIFCRCDLIVCVNSNCWCNEVTLRWRNPCKQIQPRRCVWRSVFDELVQAKATSPSLLKQLKRLRQQHQTLVSQYAALIIALFCLFKARDLYRAAQNILLYK